jgi:hypothetical protein
MIGPFAEVIRMQMLPPIHPGEVLLKDFMKPFGLSPKRVALDAFIASVEAEIKEGKTFSMFDARGEFVEHNEFKDN